MLDPQTQAALANVLRRESSSLLQYIRESFPWTTSEDRGALDGVQELASAESAAIAQLARHLLRLHGTLPALGFFPSDFTTLNFVSLHHLVPLLLEDQRRCIVGLERDLPRIVVPESRQRVEDLLALKQKHLKSLEDWAARRPPALAG